MKTILFYVSSLSKGGAERVVVTLAQHLSKEYKVIILTDSIGKNEYEIISEVRRENLSYQVQKGITKKIMGKISYLGRLRGVCKKMKPDVIISFTASSGNRMNIATIGKRYKKIVTIRSNPKNDYKTKKSRIGINLLLSGNNGFVFQTQEQKEFFSNRIQKKSTVIWNPIDEAFKKEISEIQKKVVTVGRLTRSKNHSMLLNVYDRLSKEFPDYEFFIYGDGELREEAEKQIERFENKDRIILFGEINNVNEYIKDSSVFVLSSDNEGMPNGLMEAMAIGLPVVSTDCPCGGPKALIENGENGLLVPVNNEDAMVEAISKLLNDRKFAEKLGEKARNIQDICSKEAICKQWSDFMERIL